MRASTALRSSSLTIVPRNAVQQGDPPSHRAMPWLSPLTPAGFHPDSAARTVNTTLARLSW
jgi:hypothetical protein